MGDIITLNAPISATEAERHRFETWVRRGTLRGDELSKALTRTKGGAYIQRTTRAAWLAWQARGAFDALGGQ